VKDYSYYTTPQVNIEDFKTTTWIAGRNGVFCTKQGKDEIRLPNGCPISRTDLVLKNLGVNIRTRLKDYLQAEIEAKEKLRLEFETDLFVDLGISDNPKRYELLAKAREISHNGVMSEIYDTALRLVSLIK